MTKEDIQKGNIVYYTRILPRVGIYDLCELKIRTVEETYFCGSDKHDKHAYLFGYNSLNKTIFTDRKEALSVIHNAEKKAPKVSNEKEYEEY